MGGELRRFGQSDAGEGGEGVPSLRTVFVYNSEKDLKTAYRKKSRDISLLWPAEDPTPGLYV